MTFSYFCDKMTKSHFIVGDEIMLKFGQFICKHKRIILIIALLLLIPSAIGMKATRINYDILVYLPDDIETIQGTNILAEDFNMGSYAIVLLDNMKTKEMIALEDSMRAIDGVEKVVGLADVTGTTIPIEMLPDEISEKIYKDGETAIFVTFADGISSDKTLSAVEKLRDTTDERCKVSGTSSMVLDTRNLSDAEVVIYVLIAVLLCLVILQLALDSFAAPFFILLNIGLAILYNMGSNILLGEISYITKAISAVLQLGVTMDFAIFLYHSYKAEREVQANDDEAMAHAISKTLVSVAGSSLTTIVGFLALCSMNLTLGRDIGLVMAKGVFLGVVSVVTVFPAMLLQFKAIIDKTSHKSILPQFRHWKQFVLKYHVVIAIIFVIASPFAYYGYSHTQVYYNLNKSLPDTLESVQANNALKEDFHMASTEMALVNKDLPTHSIKDMLNEIDQLDGIEWTLSYDKLAGSSIPKDMIPEEILSIFENGNYQMVIINSKYELATDELNDQIAQVTSIVKKYDDSAILAGEGPLMKDLVEISDHDFNSVNVVSIGLIFLLMFFILRSLSLPVILISVIEFAIFINMGIPYYRGTVLPFVASIVIGTIQLGATIDYAILITTKYVGLRKAGKTKNEAIDEALGTSISSIVVSGLCFFGATFGVGVYSKIEMIGSLCTLMARGAIVSMLSVIMILPSFLMIFDKLICKTTIGMRKIKN